VRGKWTAGGRQVADNRCAVSSRHAASSSPLEASPKGIAVTTTLPARAVVDELPAAPPPARARPSERHRRTARITLGVVCVTTVMLMLDIAVVNTALTNVARDLHTGLSGVQWVVDAYTLALAALVLTAGSLADRLGRRNVLVAGLLLFTAGSVGCAAATSMAMLDAARAVQGAGGAALFAVSLALLGHAYPERGDRAKALAIYGAAIGGSFAIGPLVGGLLTQHLGWRWIFVVNVPVGVLCLVLTYVGVTESRDPRPRRIDWAGQLLMCSSLFALVFALLRGNVEGWASPSIVASLAAAGILFAGFVAVERRVPEPMLPFEMFANRAFTGTQIAAFAISSSLFAVFLYITLYLQGVLGLSPVAAGAVYLPGTVLMFLVAGATAQLLTRVSPGAALSVSLLVVAGGLGLTVLGGLQSSWAMVLPGLVVACVGAGVFNPVMSGLVLNESTASRAGLAAGINDSFRQTGIAVGVAALGALVPAASAFGADSAAYVAGLHRALWVACAVATIGALAAAALFRRPRD
jgi:EmrB/QacA subfamily drug resistance transporter